MPSSAVRAFTDPDDYAETSLAVKRPRSVTVSSALVARIEPIVLR